MTIRHREELLNIEPYTPGVVSRDSSGQVAQLSSNESPYPLLEAVRTAIVSSLDNAHRYPDFGNNALTASLARRWLLQPQQVTVDSGSSALLRSITAAFAGPGTEVVFPWPSFASYEHSARISGSSTVRVPLKRNHCIDLDAVLDVLNERTRVVFLCLPNNPTGTTVSHSALERFVRDAPRDLLIVVDECYRDFATDPDAASGIRLLETCSNVLVLKSFSKEAGLAGLRVGYALSSVEVGNLLRAVAVPFSVSAVAQAAAVASLYPANSFELESRITATVSERQRVYVNVHAAGISIVPSQTNFHYFPQQSGAAMKVGKLFERGVRARLLGPTELRVSVGNRIENDRFLANLDILQ